MSELKKPAARRAAPLFRRLARLRWKVQVFSFVALNALWFERWRGYRLTNVCLPILNCHGCPAAATYCPVGVIGDMLKLRLVPWLALGTFGVVGLLFGRLSCGWVCPFGALQDLIATIPIPKLKPPRWTRFIKYAVLLGMVIIVPIAIGTETNWFFCGICPDATLLANGWRLVVEGKLIAANRLLFLALFLGLVLFVNRGFCRLVCPIGAGLALFNRVSLFSIKFDKRRCSECMQCLRRCPVEEGPMRKPRGAECIYCLKCMGCQALDFGFRDDHGEEV
ncbi:MAG: 4Fe-4S binding protein [Kiritimatiellae bacterium]|nr:4Fe-4S binding protein [Kiritimatiellia bacterium]